MKLRIFFSFSVCSALFGIVMYCSTLVTLQQILDTKHGTLAVKNTHILLMGSAIFVSKAKKCLPFLLTPRTTLSEAMNTCEKFIFFPMFALNSTFFHFFFHFHSFLTLTFDQEGWCNKYAMKYLSQCFFVAYSFTVRVSVIPNWIMVRFFLHCTDRPNKLLH